MQADNQAFQCTTINHPKIHNSSMPSSCTAKCQFVKGECVRLNFPLKSFFKNIRSTFNQKTNMHMYYVQSSGFHSNILIANNLAKFT